MTSPVPPAAPGPTADGSPPQLSGRAFFGALAALLAVFVLANPIWQAPDVQGWNENVWWSYAPIPLVVGALLVWEGKWGWGSFAHESMRLTLWKFFITYVVANTIWAVHGPPASGVTPAGPPGRSADAGPFAVADAPAFVELDPTARGDLSVTVRDARGAPVAGALVWLQGDWDDLALAPPDGPAHLVHDGRAFSPGLALVSAWQPLELVSLTDELHTAVLAPLAGGPDLFNYPLVARATRQVMFRRGHGLLEVACMAHRSSEPTTRLLVLGHPFGAFTDAAGQVLFEGVPAGDAQVLVLTDAADVPLTDGVTVEAGTAGTLTVTLAE